MCSQLGNLKSFTKRGQNKNMLFRFEKVILLKPKPKPIKMDIM